MTEQESYTSETTDSTLVVQFTGVAHISSSVWGEIIRQNKLLRETGRALRLCNLNDDLQGALKAMKLDEILFVSATRENAMADLNPEP